MDHIQAKNKIMALWKEGGHVYERVVQEEYKQIYYAVLQHLKGENAEWQNAIRTFFLHGAMSFDRFVGLRPKVADEEQYEMFCHFLNTLQKTDGAYMGRTAVLYLHRILWDINRTCCLRPYDEEMETILTQFEKNVQDIIIPEGNPRIVENLNKLKADVLGLTRNIRKGNIRTVIHTTLPYKLTNTDATIHLTVDGVEVEVKIRNHTQGSSLPIAEVAEGSTMATTGPSKWTTTTCELDIEAHCLIDILEERPKVILRGGDDDGGYWTGVFDFTFRVACSIWAYVHQQEDVTGAWPPLPTDIHYIHCRVFAGDKEYDNEFTTNPALVYHFTSLKKPEVVMDMGVETEVQWSVYAYMFAKVYAESGQLKEAVFWLNVSVEALVEEFVHHVAVTEEMLAEIEGEEHKFDTAEEILCEQFPEMKGKVLWPTTVIHTSVFTKLKRAVRKSHLAGQEKEIVKKYQQVNNKRNGLFHGGSVDISVEDVEKAFGAYGWLRDRLKAI